MYGSQPPSQGNAQYPARPQQARSGLGSHPQQQYGQQQPGGGGSAFVPAVQSGIWGMNEKFKLFVSGIAGIEEGWLERILTSVGPIASLLRPSPAFAFVEYSDPEAVLRCLEAINGLSFSSQEGSEKTLLVKADEKVRARLDEYERSRVITETTTELLSQSRADLEGITSLLSAGRPPPTGSTSMTTALDRERNKMSHLQDLVPEDLPADTRVVITSEIALFRERDAQRELDKQANEMRRRESQGRNNNLGYRPQNQNQGLSQGFGPRSVDPQSYNQPIGFVSAGVGMAPSSGSRVSNVSTKEMEVVDDDERERTRLENAEAEAIAIFRERERRFEQRERGRINNAERERTRERTLADNEDRDRVSMREKLAVWDDEVEASKGREVFYTDRNRWRQQRRPFRAREEEGDARDAAAEAHQLAALRKESEDFLERQADMFNKITESKIKAGGLPTMKEEEGVSNIKLSFATTIKGSATKIAGPLRSALLGAEDDDETDTKKRALIPLNYSDDEDDDRDGAKGSGKSKGKSKMSSSERDKKEKALLNLVPTKREAIWSYDLDWSTLPEALLVKKLGSFTNKTIVEYLGAPESELFDAVMDHLKAHKSAAELVEELEPVLDEEVTEFVTKLWSRLIYESLLHSAGLN